MTPRPSKRELAREIEELAGTEQQSPDWEPVTPEEKDVLEKYCDVDPQPDDPSARGDETFTPDEAAALAGFFAVDSWPSEAPTRAEIDEKLQEVHGS